MFDSDYNSAASLGPISGTLVQSTFTALQSATSVKATIASSGTFIKNDYIKIKISNLGTGTVAWKIVGLNATNPGVTAVPDSANNATVGTIIPAGQSEYFVVLSNCDLYVVSNGASPIAITSYRV